MTLAEKIAALRGERKLSQGDLAEKLDVSRQSVSKWETGQAVPELDKIIRLADLFGVTVDELVRDGDAPHPETPPAAVPETKIVYVERRRYTAIQTLGIILIAGGLVMILSAVFVGGDPLAFIGGFLAIAGLPLLLAKKHPFLMEGWLLWAEGALTLCNPLITGAPFNPLTGFQLWYLWLARVGDHSDYYPPVVLLVYLAYLGVAVLTLALPIYTGRLCWKWWKTRKAEEQGRQVG